MSPKNMIELIAPALIFCVLIVNGYGFGTAIWGAIIGGFLMTLILSSAKIYKAARKGWSTAGIEWRELAVKHNVDPDKFMQIPEARKSIARILNMPKQAQIEFFNQVARKYPFLRYEKGKKSVD